MVSAKPLNPGGSNMTLVKADIVQTLLDQAEIPKQEAKTLVEAVFELMKETLESGEDVRISGFGKFYLRKKAPRKGRNPATGGDLTLNARRVIMFKSSRILREKMNGAGLRTEDSH